ncbi:MAG: DUF1134 domain-containing protein [Pseudomonadota bacterium]
MFVRSLLKRFPAVVVFAAALVFSASAHANQPGPQRYSQNEVVDIGHTFFGSVSQAFAQTVERAMSRYGQPNGYILGEEASGAYIGGLRFGEGTLFTRNAGDHRVFWQGPSIGVDWGGDGNRTMILVYNLDSIDGLYKRYPGVSGSAYLVGGVGMTVLKNRNIALVPIKTGVGARLGLNVGYLKLTRTPTWNPF